MHRLFSTSGQEGKRVCCRVLPALAVPVALAELAEVVLAEQHWQVLAFAWVTVAGDHRRVLLLDENCGRSHGVLACVSTHPALDANDGPDHRSLIRRQIV